MDPVLGDNSVCDLDNNEKISQLKQFYENEIEDKNQQIYELKRQVQVATALEREYLQEIDALQADGRNENKKLTEVIENFEEEIKYLKNNYREEIVHLEQGLSDKDNEVLELQNAIKSLNDKSRVDDGEQIDKLLDENCKLKTDLYELSSQFEETQKVLEEQQKANERLETALNQLRNEFSQLEENYAVKKEEAIEKNNVIEDLRDEILVLKSDLDAAKNRPLDEESRGNSLFAEVNDRRVQLVKEMAFIKDQFKKMKQEKAEHLKEMSQLRVENAKLLQKYKQDVVEKKQDDEMLVGAHENRIRTLEKLMESYQAEIKMHTDTDTNSPGSEKKYLDFIISTKSEEIEKLRQEMNAYTVNEMMLSRRFRQCKIDLMKWKSIAMECQQENGTLKDTIKCMEMDNNIKTEPVEKVQQKTLKPPKPITVLKRTVQDGNSLKTEEKPELKNGVDTVKFVEEKTESKQEQQTENKENEESLKVETKKSAKAVTFSEDTRKSDDTNVVRRRGIPIATCKKLVIPSISKK